MALDPREIMQSGNHASEAPPAPLAGTRKQRVQRLQIGLFGLIATLLMVELANLIISSALENQAAVPDDLQPVTTEDVPPPPPSDPLADAGVVPDLPVEPEPEEDTVEFVTQPLSEIGDVPPPAEAD